MKNNLHIELEQMRLQAAAEQTQNLEFFILGHISAYDPATSSCKVIYPYYTDNSNQNFTESGWVKLATAWSGNGFGDQVAPYGGATINDLTGQTNNQNANPEQCLVFLIQRDGAYHVMGAFLFNQQDLPPGSNQTFYAPNGTSQMLTISNGERVIKHSSGTYLYFKNDGSINIIANTNPHNPFQEPDPKNLVRQVNVQAIAGIENQAGQEQPTPISISSAVQSSARTVGTNEVETVAAVNNVVASAQTGQVANATGVLNVQANGQQTSTSVGGVNVQAAGNNDTVTTSALANLQSNVTAGLDATATTNVAATANVPTAQSITAVGGVAISAQGGSGTNSASATNNINASSTFGQNSSATVNVQATANGQNDNTAAAQLASSASTGSQQSASTTVSATTGNQGTATVNISASGGQSSQITISSSGNITITCTQGQVYVDSPTVILGNGTAERILTDVAARVYNNHTHSGVQTGSGTTGTPNQQITSAQEAQNAFAS